MDDKYKKLKEEVENCYWEIKYYNEKLEKLRKSCNHPETELVNYSPRVGQVFENTEVCSICGEVINIPIGVMK